MLQSGGKNYVGLRVRLEVIKYPRARLHGRVVSYDEQAGVVISDIEEEIIVDANEPSEKARLDHGRIRPLRSSEMQFAHDEIKQRAPPQPSPLVAAAAARSVVWLDDPKLMGAADMPLMTDSRRPAHLEHQQVPTDEQIVQSCRSEDDDAVLDLPPLELDYSIIDNSELLASAMDRLNAEKALSMVLNGIGLGRDCDLCWLTLATKTDAYLLDIPKLGMSQVLEAGMKKLLESANVAKVMHDCRFAADYLYHRAGVTLAAVWDTQVASMTVRKRDNGDSPPRYVDSLALCLQQYLDVQAADAPTFWLRTYCREADEHAWRQRPLPTYMLRLIVGQVQYLARLRGALTKLLLRDFLSGIQIYLDCVRDAPDDDMEQLTNGAHLVPTAFMRDTERQQLDASSPQRDKEAVGRLTNTNIRFSKDMWHLKKNVQL